MKKFLNSVAELLPRNLIYCDVGARGGVSEFPWNNISPIIDTISFEPEVNEFNNLLPLKKDNDLLFNTALYSSDIKTTLNVTRSPGAASIYEPNMSFLEQFPDSDRFIIDDRVQIQTKTLDSFYDSGQISDLDFIKLDVQGAELDVINGGKHLLRDNVFGMNVEVEFQPLYKDQPLFSDVDQFIRNDIGLELQDIQKTFLETYRRLWA